MVKSYQYVEVHAHAQDDPRSHVCQNIANPLNARSLSRPPMLLQAPYSNHSVCLSSDYPRCVLWLYGAFGLWWGFSRIGMWGQNFDLYHFRPPGPP